MKKKYVSLLFYLFFISCAFVQKDTTHGTIKIIKPEDVDGKIYIKAEMKFDNFDVSLVKGSYVKNESGSPSPIVTGYSAPFNYTAYFNEQFEKNRIELEKKTTDTVRIAFKVLPDGNSKMLKDISVFYDPKFQAYKVDNIHLYCFHFLNGLKWIPGYIIKTKIKRIKREQVIVPYKVNIPVSGVITIIVSSAPFAE